jgi:putative ABC transport system substrate-binding protein
MCAMRKAGVLSILFVMVLLAVAVIAEAQQPKKVPRIGFLSGRPAGDDLRIETFRDGLRELGYMEGETIVIERRSAEGKLDRLPDLVAELVRIKVDVIVTGGPQVTGVAKKASVTIPIVMALDNDPVANGFVASLARPGGNITGLSTLAQR